MSSVTSVTEREGPALMEGGSPALSIAAMAVADAKVSSTSLDSNVCCATTVVVAERALVVTPSTLPPKLAIAMFATWSTGMLAFGLPPCLYARSASRVALPLLVADCSRRRPPPVARAARRAVHVPSIPRHKASLIVCTSVTRPSAVLMSRSPVATVSNKLCTITTSTEVPPLSAAGTSRWTVAAKRLPISDALSWPRAGGFTRVMKLIRNVSGGGSGGGAGGGGV